MSIRSLFSLLSPLWLIELYCTRLLGCWCWRLGSCGWAPTEFGSFARCSCNSCTHPLLYVWWSQSFPSARSSAKFKYWTAYWRGWWTWWLISGDWSCHRLMREFRVRYLVPRFLSIVCWCVFGWCLGYWNWLGFRQVNRWKWSRIGRINGVWLLGSLRVSFRFLRAIIRFWSSRLAH